MAAEPALPVVAERSSKSTEKHQRNLSINMSIKTALTKLKETARPSSDSEHSPTRKSLASFFLDKDIASSSDDLYSDDSEGMSKNEQKRRARKQKRESGTRLSGEVREHSETRRKEREEQAAREETEEIKAHYGDLPLMQSRERPRENLLKFDNITVDLVGQEVMFRARVHHVRRMSSKLVFIVFRQQIITFQGVLAEKAGQVSTFMIQWAEHIRVGSIVKVKGKLSKSLVPVVGCTIHDVELDIEKLHVIVRREEPVPFSVYEAELTTREEHTHDGRRNHILDKTRLSNRILDLRTDASQSIFRIQSAVSNLFHSALDSQGFIEIHTPKLQGSATESGASVFEVSYFSRAAFLAQSPQLAKQMAIASDFERVYEIGAVFRAENSNTHRHLTEYTGLDIEMAIDEHYHEALEVIDSVLKEIFKGIYVRYRREVDIIKHQFPHEDLVWLDKTPVILFSDGIKLLNDSGWRRDGEELPTNEDLGTRDEMRLGELIKEKYHTDYYILDKYPRVARPFYAMEDPENPEFTNSFDIFVRGQEIVSGGQRIHDEKILEKRMRDAGIDPLTMEDYLEGFRWGAPPHAGAGIGLERLVMLILKLGNIRLASMFHRDPKSFPAIPVPSILPYPDSSTIDPPWEREENKHQNNTDLHREFQPLEELIANYGDATSTSWPDPKYKIWRDHSTGAAVAYVPSSHGFAIIPGNPLSDPSQYHKVAVRFLRWLKSETHMKPIWILCSLPLEEVLGDKLGWRTLSCIGEARIDPSRNQAAADVDISKKIRHAEREGVKLLTIPTDKQLPEDLTSKIDARIADWRAHRKGPQIYLSEIKPWRDTRNYQYYYAVDKEGTICAFVALARLAGNSMQIKYSLDFPGSPSGAIESLITHAIQSVAKSGIKSLTFGAGASNHLTQGHNMSGAKAKLLQSTYDTLVKQFGLNRKTEFRVKLGAYEEPLYIAYPRNGMGSRGIRAILNFLED
ncbi:aspartate-tRNA(Asn) ligase [Paracoccidioides brasiliensis Pb18]|uniref:Aspartate--tRNA ligase, cytoplasmic n=1 Tax=Paracoccidioides brasiliensis (strain Pb18) TaxID=502780 RepID=C1GKE6_PARBD|nr:aspartate-tRNA(Asn) ligase [Paracoccidioides brasiliensis Pb18]EEH42912.1 aspartate-tRNA(Asn) ligase [Paracoccidioides brasiliensis Pb18]